MTFAPFDVVVVPFPYSDALAEKRRPAVVISSAEAIARTGQIWVAMITTSSKTVFGDVGIMAFEQAGLSVACKVRAAKVATLDADRVIRRAGVLVPEDRDRAAEALNRCAAF